LLVQQAKGGYKEKHKHTRYVTTYSTFGAFGALHGIWCNPRHLVHLVHFGRNPCLQ
jgi:hypothetical protein